MLHTHTHIYTQFHAVVGVLTDDADPMVSVMKLEKAPEETYADIGGLDLQIQEIKVCLQNVPSRVHSQPKSHATLIFLWSGNDSQ